MWWQYLLVFIGAFLFDVVAIPFPPAFTIMVFLQIMFDLNIWWVIVIGVAGSILGRYILTLYIPFLSGKIFKKSKNDDVEFLGQTMKKKGWRSQLVIVAYSLLPLPTTPLFLAAGMARIKALYIIPAFFIGKFTSDAITVHLGKYAAEHTQSILESVEYFDTYPASLALADDELFAQAQKQMNALVEKSKGASPNCTGVVLKGDVTDSILQYVEDQASDLIIIGTHGYKGIQKIMMGSVANRVLRRASCPILIFKPVQR